MYRKENTCLKTKYVEITYNLEDYEEEDYPVIIGETIGIDKESIMLHCHRHIEICYVRHGTGNYLIDGKDYTFKSGDIFIINDNEIHLAYNDKDVIMQVILFSPTLLWNGAGHTFEMESLHTVREISRRCKHKIVPSDKYYDLLVATIKEIFTENHFRYDGYKLAVKASLIKLTVILQRSFSIVHNPDLKGKEKNTYLLLPVFEYMKENYEKKIKLQELASIANMSTSNFSLIFKESVGSTPIEYLNKIHIVKATQLLLQTNDKIVDIACNCGFLSLPHFINTFKRYTGKLPRDFRKSYQYIN